MKLYYLELRISKITSTVIFYGEVSYGEASYGEVSNGEVSNGEY
jgi:hypothetical protein